MSDAIRDTTPRATSKPPASHDDEGHSSTGGDSEVDTSFGASEDVAGNVKDTTHGDQAYKTEGKQKRKRTSPKDQAILEAEYKQNPKPNKAARADIVGKVSLNEKEVQIWFQNRRQINRRKSRPLLPHEIAAFGLGGMAALTSDASQYFTSSSSPSPPEPRASSESDTHCVTGEAAEVTNSQKETPILSQSEACPPSSDKTIEDNTESPLSRPPLLKRHSSSTLYNESSSFAAPDTVIKSFTSTPGYLANRWNGIHSSFSTPASTQNDILVTPQISEPSKPNSCGGRLEMNKGSPNVRLSMSLDGKAELVTASPSPPRARETPSIPLEPFKPAKRMRTLERSQSAIPYAVASSALPAFVPSLARGRSRDARTWQICCDGDVRDELTAQAERESDGSAVAAISLIRSASNSALKASSTKRNSITSKQESRKPGSKPKMARAQSSLARLQHTTKMYDHQTEQAKEGQMRSPTGDSDKENWLPGEKTGNPRRRPLPTARKDKLSTSRSILGDNRSVPTHATNLGGQSRKRKSADIGSSIFEDQENVPDDGGDEVGKFMRGEVSPSKKGDLDCIQGLLSLSQGNWR